MINERLIGPARGPRPPRVQPCPVARAAIAVALVAGALGPAAPVVAEVINGTSGSNTDATAYSTDGNLSLTLGFFADYLVVGGGGGGSGVVIVRYQGAPAATGGDRSAGNRFAKHRSSSADIPRRKVSQAAPPLENRS